MGLGGTGVNCLWFAHIISTFISECSGKVILNKDVTQPLSLPTCVHTPPAIIKNYLCQLRLVSDLLWDLFFL
jgi:hypothetical protein